MNNSFERILIVLKPDALQRRLAGKILERFEQKGLTIAAMKLMRVSKELAARQYAQHEGKEFYEPLINYITSGPVLACVVEGAEAIATTRKMMGATFGRDAAPGTIRGDFGTSKRYNLVHGSDSLENAEFEIGLYFAPEEILSYEPDDLDWIYDMTGASPV
jgi:nucleoside-diphosphate kinase